MMNSAADLWVRRAFRIGAWGFAIGILGAFVNALYLIFDGTYQLFDKVPLTQTVLGAGVSVWAVCTFVLWIKSWAIIFPGETVESGYRPLVWALLMIFGCWVTPWYVIHRAMKEQIV